MEHRRFHRVKFTAQGNLHHQGLSYRVRLENISLNGALVSSGECILVPEGDHCSLSIRLEAQDALLEVNVQVVHSFFSMVGVKFLAMGKDTEFRLFELLKEVSAEPTKLEEEWQGLLAHKG